MECGSSLPLFRQPASLAGTRGCREGMRIQTEAGVEIPARELAGRNCRKQACGRESGSELHALQSFAPRGRTGARRGAGKSSLRGGARVATCSLGPQLFAVIGGRTADRKSRSRYTLFADIGIDHCSRRHSEPALWAKNPRSSLPSPPPANYRGPSPKRRAQDDGVGQGMLRMRSLGDEPRTYRTGPRYTLLHRHSGLLIIPEPAATRSL